jgi:stage II sporulation protein AB (anti-sigma F factor)
MYTVIEGKHNENHCKGGMNIKNEMEICFDAVSVNEGFARVAVSAFVSCLNPTLEEISDIKTAVSEAVTNSIIHGYENYSGYKIHGKVSMQAKKNPGKVKLKCILDNGILYIDVSDQGRGIEDIDKAMEPLYTTKPELDRSGMGFAFMEAFMDDISVESRVGAGTIVHMQKKMCAGPWLESEE